MRHWLHELKWQEVEEYLGRKDIVLIPVGAIEQHGRHLPLLTDSASAIDVAESVARELELLVCPPLWFGWSTHHMGYAGTITLRAETFVAVLEDICQSLVYHGFKKLILVNGNRVANLAPMEIVAVRIGNRTGAYVAVVDTGLVALKEAAEICQTLDHGGESETALMQANHPELVDMAVAAPLEPPRHPKFNYHPINLDWRRAGFDSVTVKPTVEEWKEATGPAGAYGDPLAATPEKGRQLHAAIVANVVEFLRSIEDRPVEIKDRSLPL